MVTTMLQAAGFVSGLIGMAGVFSATVMDNWCAKDRQGDVLSSLYTYKGLWRNCEVAASSLAECRPLYAALGYSGQFQAVRALMIVAIILSLIGVVFSLLSLKCLKMRTMEQKTKGKMSLSAGVILIVAAVCAISAASVYANKIVSSFMIATNQDQGEKQGKNQFSDSVSVIDVLAPRYTFGPALFIAWVGGALLLLGGLLKCVAFKGLQSCDDTGNTYVYRAPANCRQVDECQVERRGCQSC